MDIQLAKVTKHHPHLPEMKVEIINLCILPLNIVNHMFRLGTAWFKTQHYLENKYNILCASLFNLIFSNALK